MTPKLTPDATHATLRPMTDATSGTSRVRGGRRKAPTLTPTRIRTICGKVAGGVPQTAAAGAMGIPRGTFQRWLAEGRAEGADGICKRLADELDEAIAKFHESRAIEIVAHAQKDPRSAMFLLERRFPDDWGDHTKGGGVNVHVNVQASPEWRELLSRVTAVLREKHPDALRTLAAEFGYQAEEPLQIEAA